MVNKGSVTTLNRLMVVWIIRHFISTWKETSRNNYEGISFPHERNLQRIRHYSYIDVHFNYIMFFHRSGHCDDQWTTKLEKSRKWSKGAPLQAPHPRWEPPPHPPPSAVFKVELPSDCIMPLPCIWFLCCRSSQGHGVAVLLPVLSCIKLID